MTVGEISRELPRSYEKQGEIVGWLLGLCIRATSKVIAGYRFVIVHAHDNFHSAAPLGD